MFSSPFPEEIAFSCQPTDPPNITPPHPEEEILVREITSESRKQHFLAGRSCARMALSRFGLGDQPVLRNSKTREPIWPDGFFGTITHTRDWAAAAVVRKREFQGIGIDLESLERKVDPNICRHVCVAEELQWLESLETNQAEKALKLLFSAKESIFKAYFPSTRIYLHFHDALVLLNSKWNLFEYQLLNKKMENFHGTLRGEGQIQIKNSLLLTSLFFLFN